ncbi:MAG: pitrilysin family protein [Patescibacteria group bacterium]|nr:pitrilysin family protein [Patescibacteria group bacterium]
MHTNVIRRNLTNGARVIMVPRTETEVVLAMVRFGVGSRQETPDEAGLAHFLEHMFWKGTARRPSNALLMRSLVEIGAMYNAFTDKESTGYYVMTEEGFLPRAIDVLSDILLNSLFDAQALEIERTVVLSELNERNDSSPQRAYDLLYEALYPADPMGRSVGGTRDVVSALTRAQMLAFRDRNYTPQNMVITLAGKLDEDHAMILLDDAFGAFGDADAQAVEFDPTILRPDVGVESPQIVMIQRENIQQAYVCMGFETFGRDDPRRFALSLLNTIIGGNSISRLNERIRNEFGLAYSVLSHISAQRGTGQFVIWAGLKKDGLKLAVRTMVEILAELRDGGITDDDLRVTQSYIRGSMTLNFDDSSQVATFYGRNELLSGSRMTLDEYAAALQAVTVEDLNAVAGDLLRIDRLHLSIVSPFDEDPTPFEPIVVKLG